MPVKGTPVSSDTSFGENRMRSDHRLLDVSKKVIGFKETGGYGLRLGRMCLAMYHLAPFYSNYTQYGKYGVMAARRSFQSGMIIVMTL